MINKIKKEIKQLLQLPDDLVDVFLSKFTAQSIEKGANYLTEGQFCNYIALVQQGSFYSFYTKEGKELIEDFCFEGCYMADYPSFIKGIPVKKNFKALEDSQLLILSKTELEKLYKSDCQFEKAGRLVAENLFANWEQKVREVILLPPIERYKNLFTNRKDVLQRVPQYLIASYLNITPEYLSQIRRKIVS
jgi:CRP-like cAMP-binding protein